MIKIVINNKQTVEPRSVETPEVIYPQDPPRVGKWKYDPIYKSSVKGKPLIWWIEFDGIDTITMTHGQMNGAMIKSTNKIELNTSGRDMYQQSVLEIRERYKKKIQSGYQQSQIAPLSKTQSIDDSNGLGVMNSPMLAYKFQDRKIKYPMMAQPKIDGVRCTARPSVDIKNAIKVRFYSRNNNEFALLDHLREPINNFLKFLPPGSILDGELYSNYIPSQYILGMVKATKNPDPRLSQIKLWIYDIIIFDDKYKNNDYMTRYQMLIDAYIQFNQSRVAVENLLNPYLIKDLNIIIKEYVGPEDQSFEVLASNPVYSEEEVKDFHQQSIGMGYEGIMLRQMHNSPYKFGRSTYLLKYKHFQDAEAQVVGYEESSGYWVGTPIFILQDAQGRTFKATPKGDQISRSQMFSNIGDYIGKMMNYRYQELSDTGVPRFPIAMGIRQNE